jgi:hypothetical protein
MNLDIDGKVAVIRGVDCAIANKCYQKSRTI